MLSVWQTLGMRQGRARFVAPTARWLYLLLASHTPRQGQRPVAMKTYESPLVTPGACRSFSSPDLLAHLRGGAFNETADLSWAAAQRQGRSHFGRISAARAMPGILQNSGAHSLPEICEKITTIRSLSQGYFGKPRKESNEKLRGQLCIKLWSFLDFKNACRCIVLALQLRCFLLAKC